jgi:hypothetical protein
VSKFYPSGDKIWLEFSITLVFTSFGAEEDYILAGEDGALILEEENTQEDIFISVK